MEPKRFAVVDKNGLVVNAILALPDYVPPAGFRVIESDHAGPGDTWNGSDFTKAGAATPASAADVNTVAQARIIALTGATDFDSCIVKQLNALMRATELTNKRALGQPLTDDETAQATALQAMADAIKGVRDASNVLNAMTPIPLDYSDNGHWPPQ